MQEVQFYERAQAQTHSMTLACMAQVQQYRARAAEWAPLAAEAKSTAGQERYRSQPSIWWELAAAMERLKESVGRKKISLVPMLQRDCAYERPRPCCSDTS